MKTKLISTRISAQIEKEIERLAREEHIQKTVLFRKILVIGLQELKERYALELYKQGKITLWKTAELANLSLWEILEKIKAKKIPAKYDLEDAKEDLKLIFGE